MRSRESQPQPDARARTLHVFLAYHLPRLRGMSPNTVRSYRDSLTLLLRFVGGGRGSRSSVWMSSTSIRNRSRLLSNI